VRIVGERINATRKRVAAALERRDEAFIQAEARKQAEAGADLIDVNADARVGHEAEDLRWLAEAVQAAVELPLCLDSASLEAHEAALKVHRGPALLNSANAEAGRLAALLPLAKEHEAELVCLTTGESGVPQNAEERVALAHQMAEAVSKAGVPLGRIYFDPAVTAVATAGPAGRDLIGAVRRIRSEIPDAHVICGLSNVSFGLPQRGLLNRTFLAMLMASGLDAAILDPTRPGMMPTVRAAEALLGRDDFCLEYITAQREGKLET